MMAPIKKYSTHEIHQTDSLSYYYSPITSAEFHCILNWLQYCCSETVPDCRQTDEVCGTVVHIPFSQFFFFFFLFLLLLDLHFQGVRCQADVHLLQFISYFLSPLDVTYSTSHLLILTTHPVYFCQRSQLMYVPKPLPVSVSMLTYPHWCLCSRDKAAPTEQIYPLLSL